MGADDIIKAIEDEFPDAAWRICRVTNPGHSSTPYGAGYTVEIHLNQEVNSAFWEKAATMREAYEACVHRARRAAQAPTR